MDTVAYIFRRDLRLVDNTALKKLSEKKVEIMPCFNFDPRQVDKNPYKSIRAIQFMIESLEELQEDIRKKGGKLNIFYGTPEEMINKLKVTEVHVNRDYTPFSKKRDIELEKACKKKGIKLVQHNDYLLTEPEEVVHDGKPYKVFTPFYNKAKKLKVDKPAKYTIKFSKKKIKDAGKIFGKILKKREKQFQGGRKAGLKILKNIAAFTDYDEIRNRMEVQTTRLSAHNKFGTISIREVYNAIKETRNEELIRQLYWRDFFTHVVYNFPYVIGKPFYKKYEKLKWENDKTKFKKWCEGKTGFPIIDAGMRELNETGYMHNRARLIVASFLVKDLRIDWRWGEKYFAQKLIDYDISVNNGNWQWSASVGCDPRPLRIFNPWLQQKKYDPDCVYIKRWVPELKKISAYVIHGIERKPVEGYTEQIVDHTIEQRKTKEMYKKAK